MVVCLSAIAAQEDQQTHVFCNVHHLDSEEGHAILFLKCSDKVHYRLYCRSKHGIATDNDGHLSCQVSQLERFCLHGLAAVVPCDAPHQQRSLNSGDITSLLKVMQCLKPMPYFQQSHGSSFIDNVTSGGWGIITFLRATCRGISCDEECPPRVVELIHIKGLLERKNADTAYFAECNLRVIDQVEPEEDILVALMGNIELCDPHSRVCSHRSSVIGRNCQLSDLSFHIGRRSELLCGSGDSTSKNHCLGGPCVVHERTHVARC